MNKLNNICGVILFLSGVGVLLAGTAGRIIMGVGEAHVLNYGQVIFLAILLIIAGILLAFHKNAY